MFLREAKIGARVIMYLNESGFVSARLQTQTVIATLYCRSKDNPDEIYIGWKAGDILPVMAQKMGALQRHKLYEYSNDAESMKYVLAAFGDWEIAGIVADDLLPETVRQPGQMNQNQKQEKPDWQFFKSNIPGECSCGINRKDCEFHG